MALPAGQPNPYGGPPRSDYAQLEAFLGGDLNTIPEDLSDGAVDGLADILLVIAPENLDEKAVFAIEKFGQPLVPPPPPCTNAPWLTAVIAGCVGCGTGMGAGAGALPA
jgi:hypothetical protein